MSKNGFDLIIFDCDGVLVDSEIVAARIESKLLSEAGYPISAEEMGERFAGMTWKNILLAVEAEASIPLSASLLDKSEKLLDEKLGSEVKMIDGVRFALSRLTQPRCICSNSTSHRLALMLKHTGLMPYFDGHVYSARDLGEDRIKPKPDIFLHAAKQMNAVPTRTVVIEDSVPGVTAAKAAGMRVIGFTGGSHTYLSHADGLTEGGAETVISRMSELPAVVEALAGWNELI